VNKHYHLIGIGGIGMSGIAQLLLRSGFKVTGSDLKEGRAIEGLRAQGAEVFLGHRPENIKGADSVIYSSAISETNSEILEAKRTGTPLIKRAEALADLMKDKRGITVAGSHGKTTTTSLISCLLLEADLCPTVAIGGILRNIDANVCLGKGSFFVAEADESDGSFLCYKSKYSIITNIDYEHLDYYKDFENELDAYRNFLDKVERDGCVFCCGDDPNLRGMLKSYKNRFMLFGLKENNDIYPKNITFDGLISDFDCFYKNKFLDRFHLPLGGEHNISNALSVIALGLELNIDLEVIKRALANYRGARRRLEVKFSDEDYIVVDDYAHHPTEIKATLSAIKNLRFKRLIAVFQPHRFTRTKLLLDEFSGSFDLADYLIITDIYPAGEQPLEGVSARSIHNKIKQRFPEKQGEFLAKEGIVSHILKIKRAGDLILILGAGDIVKICNELVQRLKKQSKV